MDNNSKRTSGQGGKATYRFVPGAGPKADTPVEYALAQARLTITTMPVRNGTKMPLLSKAEGGHGWKTCSTDPDTLSIWFSDPEAAPAISPAMCGLLLVDVDDRHDGDKVFTTLQRKLGRTMFDTPGYKTGGGERLIFAYPLRGLGEYENYDLSLPKEGGFELFGDAPFAKPNYAVAPNSRHESGALYEYPRGESVWDKPARPFPLEMLPLLADYFEQQPSPKKAKKAKAEAETPAAPADAATQVSAKQLSALREWDRDAWFVCEVMRKLVGVPDFEIGRNFHSPLRPDDKKASCTVIEYQGGEFRYKDFGGADGGDDKPYALAQVFAAVVGGQKRPPRTMTPVQFAMWQTRLLSEVGAIEPDIAVDLPPLDGAKHIRSIYDISPPPYVHQVYEGFWLALVCQAYHYGEVRAVPYTWRFAEGWAGVTPQQAETAVRWLKRNDYLVRVGYLPRNGKTYRPTGLFLPRGYEDFEFSEAALSQNRAPRPNKKRPKRPPEIRQTPSQAQQTPRPPSSKPTTTPTPLTPDNKLSLSKTLLLVDNLSCRVAARKGY